jgi:hypothetical protein
MTNGALDCFLSDVQGDVGFTGNGAGVEAGVLTVTNAAGDSVYASATCFGGGTFVPFTDFVVDARTSSPNVPLLPDTEALCGLSAVASFDQADSSVVVGNGAAIGVHSYSAFRCFRFDQTDAN